MIEYTGTIAHVDLSNRRVQFERITLDLIRKWGGGSGIASWRLYNQIGERTQPLDPENEVWIIGGPLTGTRAPCSGRIEIVTKSALTGILGLSSTGGQFGARLKHAGFDGIVLHGTSIDPVYLLIRPGTILFRDASHLWGKDTWETEKLIGTELSDPGVKRIKIMAIGPAGENLVRFACLINERYHAAARGGAGAVFGAKKVKALVVDSDRLTPACSAKFRDAAARMAKKIKNDPACQKYTKFGSTPASDSSLATGEVSGWNFQQNKLPRWLETRGTNAIMSFITGPEGSCYNCAMPCFNRVEVQEGEYKGLKIASGTFVQVVLEFGAKCGIESLPAIWKCKELCHRQGLDYGSTGGAIAFGMELFQKEILTTRDTDGLPLTWGDERVVFRLIGQIARREGLGDVLAEGTLRASKKLGSPSIHCVMAIKGMEMISPDPRTAPRAVSLGSLTSPRGGDNVRGTHMKGEMIPLLSILNPENHLEWESYSNSLVSRLDIFPEVKGAIYGDPPRVHPFIYEGKALMTKWFEDLFAAVNAWGLCIFPADKLAIGPTDYADLISSFLEEEIAPEEFMEIGERIFNIQRLYLIREGISRKDDTWPARFFEEGLSEGPLKGVRISREVIEKVLDDYYNARGWDQTTGYPTSQTLAKLDIDTKLLEGKDCFFSS